VHQVGAHKSSLEIVEGCSRHDGKPIYRIRTDLDNLKAKVLHTV
jgi:hypothetical protein